MRRMSWSRDHWRVYVMITVQQWDASSLHVTYVKQCVWKQHVCETKWERCETMCAWNIKHVKRVKRVKQHPFETTCMWHTTCETCGTMCDTTCDTMCVWNNMCEMCDTCTTMCVKQHVKRVCVCVCVCHSCRTHMQTERSLFIGVKEKVSKELSFSFLHKILKFKPFQRPSSVFKL